MNASPPQEQQVDQVLQLHIPKNCCAATTSKPVLQWTEPRLKPSQLLQAGQLEAGWLCSHLAGMYSPSAVVLPSPHVYKNALVVGEITCTPYDRHMLGPVLVATRTAAPCYATDSELGRASGASLIAPEPCCITSDCKRHLLEVDGKLAALEHVGTRSQAWLANSSDTCPGSATQMWHPRPLSLATCLRRLRWSALQSLRELPMLSKRGLSKRLARHLHPRSMSTCLTNPGDECGPTWVCQSSTALNIK